MIKNILIICILTSYGYTKNTDILWRISMFASIATFYGANILQASEGGVIMGVSDDDILIGGLELKWHKKNIGNIGKVGLGYYHRASYEVSTNSVEGAFTYKNNKLSYNPFFRIQLENIHIDYSMGATLMSFGLEKKSNPNKHNGKFAFNHILSIGINMYDMYLSGSFKHYSNNGIYKQNSGANFMTINMGYKY